MKKTKFLLLGMLVAMFTFFVTSCEKDFVDDFKTNEVEVQFKALNLQNELKTDAFDVECSGEEVVSARIVIDGTEYNPLVMDVDGELLTQVIKLTSGTYEVTEFMLLDGAGNIVQATPAAGSDFAVYVSETVPFELVVPEFDKVERTVEVLCYTEAEYISFGFNWFNIGQVEVHQLLFFGDLCYFPDLYVGSLYDEVFDLSLYPIDIIALFEIRTFVEENGDWKPLKVFSNVSNPNEPLVTEWYTHSNGVLDFKFELWVLVYTGMGEFDYVLFDEFLFDSENPLTADTHNVVDFVIGNCVYTPAQFEYDPHEPIEFIAGCDAEIVYDLIIQEFPEQENAMNNLPHLFDPNNQLNVITNVDVDVWVEFIFEGAGWVNTFGYYTYEVGQKPTDPSQLNKTVIWPQVDDNVIFPGDLFQIGQLPENTVIGFYLVAQGWQNGQMVNGIYTHYTDFDWNENETQQHTLFIENECNSLILTFEDIKLPGGDKDFNDLIIRVLDNVQGFQNQANSFDVTNIPFLLQ